MEQVQKLKFRITEDFLISLVIGYFFKGAPPEKEIRKEVRRWRAARKQTKKSPQKPTRPFYRDLPNSKIHN